MRSWLSLHLLLGLLPLGEGIYPPGSCDAYTNISDPWRNEMYESSYFQKNPPDDADLLGKWWRFVGVGGDIVYTGCPSRGVFNYKATVEDMETMPQSESSTETRIQGKISTNTNCRAAHFSLSIVLCPGGFYIYKPITHPRHYTGFITRHSVCRKDCCGPKATCYHIGLCKCIPGYSFNELVKPEEPYMCEDIDECVKETCWPHSQCINFPGGYNCSCLTGFEASDPNATVSSSNPCNDIDECEDAVICGPNATCLNSEGSFECQCLSGFAKSNITICEDIDECLDVTLCGPNSICTNSIGLWSCACDSGFRATDPTQQPSQQNICVDIEECEEEPSICGSNGVCTNTEGSFFCSCFPGFRLSSALIGAADPCIDIDECAETPGLCGELTICFNKPGTYYCSCSDGHYPSTGIIWTEDTFCKSLVDVLDELEPSQDQTKEMAFFAYMDQQLEEIKGSFVPEAILANCFSASMEVAGVGPYVSPPRVSSAGDGETGSIILDIAERFIARLLLQEEKQLKLNLETATFSLDLVTFGPKDKKSRSVPLTANQNVMEINMESLAQNNNGFAAAAFLVLRGLESLLSHQFFETENMTQFSSDVFTAFLPAMNNTNLTEPVNFTIQHNKVVPESAVVSCVFWEVDSEPLLLTLRGQGPEQGPRAWGWSEQGCWASYTDHNYTVCSCSHLSTFALILQTGEPPPQSDFLDWLNRICVIVGLFFFALAVLTFLLCSWNPKINNTARLHLCLNLGLSHFLLLFNDLYIKQPVACKALAGILHFLVVSSFVWMQLEAVQLLLLVRRLNRVQVIERDGLPKLALYLVGYGVPLVVVGVSALVYHRGYGRTDADVCWLSTTRNFNWALTGPVIAVLGMNCLLFLATLWSLRATLANMRSGASESSDIRLVLFKIVAQFVILGCTWILGLYQTNLFFQILFIVLNSQQGTFLYFVHCVLNREIREECLKRLTCSHNKNQEEADVVSATEDQHKTE